MLHETAPDHQTIESGQQGVMHNGGNLLDCCYTARQVYNKIL